MTDPSPAAARHRRWWRRRLVDPLVQQLTQGVTPERVALTLAVGSALALFPILGTTTLLCALVGVALRLNQPIIQSVNVVCTVVYLPALVALVRLGDWLAGGVRSSLDIPVMVGVFRRHPAEFFQRFGTTAWHGVLGWLALVPLWLIVIYLGALPGLRRLLRVLRRRGSGPGAA
jgi:uncharacterized protein (DUF2062 family)